MSVCRLQVKAWSSSNLTSKYQTVINIRIFPVTFNNWYCCDLANHEKPFQIFKLCIVHILINGYFFSLDYRTFYKHPTSNPINMFNVYKSHECTRKGTSRKGTDNTKWNHALHLCRKLLTNNRKNSCRNYFLKQRLYFKDDIGNEKKSWYCKYFPNFATQFPDELELFPAITHDKV